MIERYVSDDALRAKEEILFVPVPVNATEIEDGFAGQVLRAYPLAESRLQTRGGLEEGRVLYVGTLAGDWRWLPLYTLAFAAIHHREPNGWEESPTILRGVLAGIAERFSDKRLAVAGIPGTGFSGIKSAVRPSTIEDVMEESAMRITVYQNGLSGDRAELLHADPQLDQSTSRDLVKQTLR